MPSHRLSKLTVKDYEITGYSVAGEETVVAVPKLDICFDIGKAPEQFIPINNLLISHGHIDHTAGIAYYLSHRQFCGIAAGKVYLPKHLVEPVNKMIEIWGNIDGTKIPECLIGVSGGDEYKIKPNLSVKVFKTKHCYGSVGYTAVEKRTKLKKEYVGLDAQELVKLKKEGVNIERQLEIPLVSYLGDTQITDYSQLDFVAKSKILIVECTFFEYENNHRADAGKHMHVETLSQLLEPLENEHIIITHLSQRTSIREAKKLIKQKLPADIYSKIILLMDRQNRK